MHDTSAQAMERYTALLRGQRPFERLRQAASLSKAVRELAIAGIRTRHPTADPREVFQRLAVLLYGREAALRMFGEVPRDLRVE